MELTLNDAVESMISAAASAGEEMMKLQPSTRRLSTRKDFLTDADGRSEQIILDSLKYFDSGIPFYSEEAGGEARTEGLVWVIDPIDGTVNFFLQDELWGISIALVKDGRTIAAVVHLPRNKVMYTATKDSVAYRVHHNNKKEVVSVSEVTLFDDTQYWFDWGKMSDYSSVYALIKKLNESSLYPQTRGCSVASALAVATGRIGGYFFPTPEPFDIAATGLIIEKAGGLVTDFEGRPWSPYSKSFLASNGFLHEELLKVVSDL